jgi:hypothetical protein
MPAVSLGKSITPFEWIEIGGKTAVFIPAHGQRRIKKTFYNSSFVFQTTLSPFRTVQFFNFQIAKSS